MQKKTFPTISSKLFSAIVFALFILGCSFVTQNFEKGHVSEYFTPESPTEISQETSDGSLYRFECGVSHYGYIDRQGTLVVPPEIEDAGLFHEGLALVGSIGTIDPDTNQLQEGKYGYIDSSGKYAIQPKFPSAAPFSEGLAAAASPEDPELFGYIDKTGQFVIAPKYFGTLAFGLHDVPGLPELAYFHTFHEGYAIVPADPNAISVNFIDQTGNVLSPPGPVRRATSFSNGFAIINNAYIINRNGQTVAQVEGCTSINPCYFGPFSEGLAPIDQDYAGKTRTGFIDETGNVVISEQFSSAKPFTEGMAAVQDIETQLWGYIDRSGNLIIPYKYSEASIFSEGLASVDGGYIDKTGKVVIPKVGEPFHNGLALVRDGFIDKNGDYVYKICSP